MHISRDIEVEDSPFLEMNSQLIHIGCDISTTRLSSNSGLLKGEQSCRKGRDTILLLEYSTGLQTFPSGRNFDADSIFRTQTWREKFKKSDDPLSPYKRSSSTVCIEGICLDVDSSLEVREDQEPQLDHLGGIIINSRSGYTTGQS